MKLEDAMKKRYSVREYQEKEVEESKIKKILEAGFLAPTAHNEEPCMIRVIKSKSGLELLKKVTECHYDAPLAFLITYKSDECWVREFDNKKSGDIDSTIITTYMMLEAESLGLSTCYVMYFEPDKVVKEFNLEENEIPSLILLCGYEGKTSRPSRLHINRKNRKELLKEI